MAVKEINIDTDNTHITDAIAEVRAFVEETESNSLLHDEPNFVARAEVIDFIEFEVMGQIEQLREQPDDTAMLDWLQARAQKIKAGLEALDNSLFERLRAEMQSGMHRGQTFKELIAGYLPIGNSNESYAAEQGYDVLDTFINGLFSAAMMPEPINVLEQDMISFQKTPARVIFQLVERYQLTQHDVVVDIGSGLGQVVLLLHLLTGATVKGIEQEPAFCAYASDCAASLGLQHVAFIRADARDADYSTGTVFFMYTPFTGDMLDAVLERLCIERLHHCITIITYGPCTAHIAAQGWLRDVTNDFGVWGVGVFRSG